MKKVGDKVSINFVGKQIDNLVITALVKKEHNAGYSRDYDGQMYRLKPIGKETDMGGYIVKEEDIL